MSEVLDTQKRSAQTGNGQPKPPRGDTQTQRAHTHPVVAGERVKSVLFLNAYHMGGTMPGPWWDHPSNWDGEQNPTIQKREDFFLLKYEWSLNLYKKKNTFLMTSRQTDIKSLCGINTINISQYLRASFGSVGFFRNAFFWEFAHRKITNPHTVIF